MRYFQVLFLVLVVSGCASTETKGAKSGKASAHNAIQHVYLSGVIAKFYCDNAYWPQSLEVLNEYAMQNPTPISAKIDWNLLSQNDVTFHVATDIFIRTPENTVNGSMSVRSIHKYPDCNGDSIKVNFHPMLGD